jgi:hypothetical protein
MDWETYEGDYNESWQRWYKDWQDKSIVYVDLPYEPNSDPYRWNRLKNILETLKETQKKEKDI